MRTGNRETWRCGGRKLLPWPLLCLLFSFFSSDVVACVPHIHWNDSITFCKGNSVTLDATNPNSTYFWSTGATSSTITVSGSGTFWVTVTNPCGSTSDTVHISADEPLNISLGANRNLCSQGNTTLSLPYDPFAQYKWQDGSTSHQYNVTQSGTYWVEVTNGCGKFSDTVQIGIDDPPNPDLGPDINHCSPTTTNLSVSAPSGTGAIWSTGAMGSSINVSGPGTYWVKLTNACGTASDTIEISFAQGQNLDLGDTISKCSNGTATIVPNVLGGAYQWSTGSTGHSIVVQNPGLYWLQYTDNCGSYTDSVYVINSGKATVDLGPDTSICKGDVLQLDAGNPGSQFLWQNNPGGRFFDVDTAGTYWVSVDNGCGASYDSITVSVIPVPHPDIISDSVFFCQNSSVTVDAGHWGPSTSYMWDNGSSSRTRTFSTGGTYSVQISNDCGSIVESFEVVEVSALQPDLGNDTVVCGNEFTLTTKVPDIGNDYMWNTGATDTSLTVTASGRYYVEVTNDCGTYTDTIDVELIYPPQKSGNPMLQFCQGSTVDISVPYIDSTTYQWSNGGTGHKITVNTPGTYTVEAVNICDTIIDTIQVVEVKPLDVDLGPDTSFCEPGILYLDVSSYQADAVKWSTGSRNGGLPITTSGTYWVELENLCGIFADTIQVQVDPLPRRTLRDTAVCSGDSVILDVSQAHVQEYTWSTGATSSHITISQEGWYYVDMVNHCDTVRDSVYVRVDNPIPQFDLGNDTIFCQGTLLLDPGSFGGASYLWQNGSPTQTFLVTQSGTYYVTATNTCNTYTDTIEVLITGPPKLVLGEQVTFCHTTILTLNAQNPGSTYLWNTGDTTQTLDVDTAGVYWVQITNDCGQLTDTVTVFVDYPMDDIDLGRDTLICRGEQLVLNTGYPRADTKWSTGAITPSITVTETGTYRVEVANRCGQWSDSIFVFVEDVPEFSLGKDSAICAFDGRFPVSGPAGMQSYRWSNGDSTQSTVFRTSGYHWLTVSNHCFSYTDTIFLKEDYPIDIDLGADTVVCFGKSVLLDPGNIDYRLWWSNNKRGSTLEVTRSGTYWVEARNTCGVYSDTVTVNVDYPLDNDVEDTTICKGDSALFHIPNSRYTIEWEDEVTDQLRYFPEEGIYPYTIINKCGSFAKEFEVRHSNCDCPLHMANAFTPNDDGRNDEYHAVHDCPLTSFRIWIFNRWGELVFYSENVDEGWDGNQDGAPHPIGTYHYRIEYTWDVYGVECMGQKIGLVHLIR